MAEIADLVSPLCLFRLEEVPGKGIGCLANQDIEKGALVLRETPQFSMTHSTCDSQEADNIINAFKKMSTAEQEAYMKLHDGFDQDKSNWTTQKKWIYQRFEKAINEKESLDISKAKALKVGTILLSNSISYKNRLVVAIMSSRFNHSCSPNAYTFQNVDTGTRDTRAVKNIKQGEEISVSYISLMETVSNRRVLLKEWYNFDCRCEACEAPEEDSKKEDVKIERYKLLEKQAQEIKGPGALQTLLRRKEECLKELCLQVKKIETVGMEFRMATVLEVYKLCCAGRDIASTSCNLKTDEIVWTKKAMMYADMLLAMFITVYGEDYSMVKNWRAIYKEKDDHFRKLLRE